MTIDEIIVQSLKEDIGDGDHTSKATIPIGSLRKAKLIVKDHGVLCGVDLASRIFRTVDRSLEVSVLLHDGTRVSPGDVAFVVSGEAASILKSERLVLNFLQRLSGIATATENIVASISDLNTVILDTRKTTPLLRELEKYAVRIGGGFNHRMGLYDMIMIKDNHVDYAGGISEAIKATVRYLKNNMLSLKIEIEVRNFFELEEVIDFGNVDRVMLDNFNPTDLKKAIQLIGGRFETEASGGITADNIREYAETGVDFISIGALTHQIRSLDMSLKAVI